MTATSKTPDPMEFLMDVYLAELQDMTDEAVLDGRDPAEVQAAALRRLDAAKADAGRRRLAAARQKLEANRGAPLMSQAHITPQEARAYLRKAVSANDGRYTLAARGLEDMSDVEAVRMYLQVKKLEEDGEGELSGDPE